MPNPPLSSNVEGLFPVGPGDRYVTEPERSGFLSDRQQSLQPGR